MSSPGLVHGPTPPIDVIVPVRGAGAVFARCAASLARHMDPERHRIVIVLDGPADADTVRAVQALEHSGVDLKVLENGEPRGFVSSANLGLGVSGRDAVLLNSDTQVTKGWLDKLAAAAYADPGTATVTPFSNNATICSLPVFLAENALPAGWSLDAFASLVERVSTRAYPRLPTGVGVCLYIRRSVLNEIGGLSEAFGEGYGEEVDFCLRASARGYHHVLDDATFIFHEGSRSFGTSRRLRVRRAHRLLHGRYPTYQAGIHAFIQQDPLAPARARLVAGLGKSRPALRTPPAIRVLHLVHGWPPWAHGGTETYAHGLAHAQARRCEVAVFARLADADRELGHVVEQHDDGVGVRLIVNNFTQRNPFSRNGFHCAPIAREFGRYLDEFRPDILHVHHLAGHGASLLGVARGRGIPVLYQAQDWWPLCARSNLCNNRHEYCAGPAPLKCARCLPMTRLAPALVASAALHTARRAWIRSQLTGVDVVVMGSEFIAESYRNHRLLPPGTPVHVVPYGVATRATPVRPARTTGLPLRFGYVGALLPHKGVHIAIEAFRLVNPRHAEMHVWGSGTDPSYAAALASAAGGASHIHFRGAFSESQKSEVFGSFDALIVPSVGLESFGLVAREAMALGVPVLASRRGALVEMFTDGEGGTFFAPGDAGDLARHVLRAIEDPGLLDRWRRSLPAVKSTERHADEIEDLYQSMRKLSRR